MTRRFYRLFLPLLAVLLATPAAAEGSLPNPQVVIETTQGNITVRLFRDKAPATVENFLQYVEDGFYDGTIFHRVIPNFMIQGGGFMPDMTEKSKSKTLSTTTHAPVELEQVVHPKQ